jgi:RimJ/RimL family protein N-acetyltransferase
MSMAIAGTVSHRTNRVETLFRVGRIAVRQYAPTDIDELTRVANFSAVAKTLLMMPHPYQRHHAQQWVRINRRRYRRPRSQHRHYAITYDDVIIGGIGSDRQGSEAVFGYWLTPAYWGRGIMTTVIRNFVPHVWRWWPITRLNAQVFTFNPASARVLEKAGFTHAALELRAVQKGQRWFDVDVYTRARPRV